MIQLDMILMGMHAWVTNQHKNKLHNIIQIGLQDIIFPLHWTFFIKWSKQDDIFARPACASYYAWVIIAICYYIALSRWSYPSFSFRAPKDRWFESPVDAVELSSFRRRDCSCSRSRSLKVWRFKYWLCIKEKWQILQRPWIWTVIRLIHV